jgi:hypothetical protein
MRTHQKASGHTHTFINRDGQVQSAEVSGDNLVAMQDYREEFG